MSPNMKFKGSEVLYNVDIVTVPAPYVPPSPISGWIDSLMPSIDISRTASYIGANGTTTYGTWSSIQQATQYSNYDSNYVIKEIAPSVAYNATVNPVVKQRITITGLSSLGNVNLNDNIQHDAPFFKAWQEYDPIAVDYSFVHTHIVTYERVDNDTIRIVRDLTPFFTWYGAGGNGTVPVYKNPSLGGYTGQTFNLGIVSNLSGSWRYITNPLTGVHISKYEYQTIDIVAAGLSASGFTVNNLGYYHL